MAGKTSKVVGPTIEQLRRDLATATSEREATAARAADAHRRMEEARQVLDPNARNVSIEATPSDEDIWRARAAWAELVTDCARARLAAATAVRAAEVVTAALRAAELSVLHPRKQAAISALVAALTTARHCVDALVMVEDAEQTIAVGSVERLAAPWCALQTGTSAAFQPQLDYWVAYVRSQGFEIDG